MQVSSTLVCLFVRKTAVFFFCCSKRFFFTLPNVYLQSTVSESTLVALLAARKNKILQLQAEQEEELDDSVLNSRLVVYTSDQVSFNNFMKNNFLKVI